MIHEIKVSGIKYNIRCITHGDPSYFSQTSYDFEAEIDGVFVPLKFHIDKELVQDLCAIMGLDPVKELVNIAIVEIKKELSERITNDK